MSPKMIAMFLLLAGIFAMRAEEGMMGMVATSSSFQVATITSVVLFFTLLAAFAFRPAGNGARKHKRENVIKRYVDPVDPRHNNYIGENTEKRWKEWMARVGMSEEELLMRIIEEEEREEEEIMRMRMMTRDWISKEEFLMRMIEQEEEIMRIRRARFSEPLLWEVTHARQASLREIWSKEDEELLECELQNIKNLGLAESSTRE